MPLKPLSEISALDVMFPGETRKRKRGAPRKRTLEQKRQKRKEYKKAWNAKNIEKTREYRRRYYWKAEQFIKDKTKFELEAERYIAAWENQ